MAEETKISGNTLLSTGSLIDDKWVLIESVGKGGMGEVFRAHQLNLKRDVAIKVISEEFLEGSEENPEELARATARFQREVQIMAKVRHPNVLQIYDYGTVTVQKAGFDNQMQYIAMEYVPGNTLRYTMSEEGFDNETDLLIEWIQQYFLPVIDGVEAIHANGVVHRDVKPENILMDDETPKIMDFGLSRSPGLKAVSNSWDVKGTVSYMAPEQFIDFRKAGITADIYSLGKILYEAICGKLDPKMVPFKQAVLADPQTDILKSLDTVIQKTTDEDPKQRYQSIAELRQVILEALSAERLKKERGKQAVPEAPAYVRTLWIGIIAVLVALGAMTIYHILDDGDKITLTKDIAENKSLAVPQNPAELPPTWAAADEREMQLVNDTETHQPFYGDRSLVTFHHYVEFLNEISDRLEVSDGVVRYNKDIWVYLGDGSEPANQIVYQNSHFYLRSAEWAPKPVVRVTGLGAAAYADHYNKHLPTYDEWESLDRHLGISNKGVLPSTTVSGDGMHSHMTAEPMDGENNLTQGNSQQGVAKEWLDTNSDSKRPSGVLDWSSDSYVLTKRYPWEGFPDVGFRTVLDIHINRSSEEDK